MPRSPHDSSPRPFSRDRWPEYADPLHLEPRAHRRLAEQFMDADEPRPRRHDWARRFDISAAGWALAEVHPPREARSRYVVYPVNISLTGVAFIHAAPLPDGTRVSIHFDRLVTGAFSLWGQTQRTIRIDRRCWVNGVRWDPDSGLALIEHLSPEPSDAALRSAPFDPSPEQDAAAAAHRSIYAENRLGNWAAIVAGD